MPFILKIIRIRWCYYLTINLIPVLLYCAGATELKQLSQMVLELERSVQKSASGQPLPAEDSKLQLHEQLAALRNADSNSARALGQLERKEQTLLTQLRQFERELSTISEQSTRCAITSPFLLATTVTPF